MARLVKVGEMDLLDVEIIKLLEVDARRSSTELAKQLYTSAATIRRRIRRLIKSDTIRISAFINPEKIGLLLTVLIALKVANSRVDSIMRKLSDRPEITWVASTTGQFNIVCSAQFSGNKDLDIFLNTEVPKLDAEVMTETFICLKLLVKSVLAKGIRKV